MTKRWWQVAAAIGAGAALAGRSLENRGWLLDDAFITFRYADHLAAGYGPVFNPGERVEGYTSFLWMALLAGLRRLGVEPVAASVALGLLCGAAVIALVLRARHYVPSLPAGVPALAALFLGTCGVFSSWPASGMEVALFTLLLLWAVLLAAAGRVREPSARLDVTLGIALGLLTLTRPEGYLVAGLLLADTAWRRRWQAWRAALPCLAMAGGHEAWRLAYYGLPLPNTFYAKVGWTPAQVGRGLEYGWRFLTAAFPVVIPALAALATRWWRKPAPLLPLMAVTAAFSAYVVAVGGDCMPSFRFFAPLLPLVSLLAAYGVHAVAPNRRLLGAVAAVVVLGNVCRLWLLPAADFHTGDPVARDGRVVGLWLREHARPEALLATNTAGTVPYYSGLRTVDMLGLNDAHIAHRPVGDMGRGFTGHEKGDGAYVLRRQPDYILFGSACGSLGPVFRSDRELEGSRQFQQQYRLRVYWLAEIGKSLFIYERR